MADIRQNPSPLDDFTRADETPLSHGGDWTDYVDNSVWGPLRLLSNVATLYSGESRAASYWNAMDALDGDDQECWGFGVGGGSSGIYWGPMLVKDFHSPPGSGLTVDGYTFQLVVGSGGPAWSLKRYTNFSPVTIDGPDSTGAVSSNPGYMLIRRNGNDVEGWQSPDGVTWTLRVSATDTTYMTGLHPALSLSDDSEFHIVGWTEFGGGVRRQRTQIYRYISH